MSDERLVELLVEWEEHRHSDTPLSAADLCPDDPVMCAELEARIARRQRLAPVIDMTATVADATQKPDAIPTVDGYELLEVIGHGGMGIVYKARQLGLNRIVALKMILAGSSATEKEKARFLTEAQAVAKLSHTNIVQVFDVGHASGHAYLAMEYLAEGSLAARLDAHGMDPRLAAEILLPLADAVAHAHTHGIVHRDLKPANILLNPRSGDSHSGTGRLPLPFVPKVADFGLAKRLDTNQGHTQTGAVLGSPSYMPPEQAIGATDIGTAADVYGLGAVLYEMLTGRPPFRGASFLETLELVRHADPIPLRHFRSVIPRDLEIICLKCLEKDPARRYANAGELADDLRRFLSGDPIHAKVDSLGSQLARIIGRTDLDHRAAEFAKTVIWMAPIGVVPQTILYLGWRKEDYYPQLVLGVIIVAILVMIVIVLGFRQTWLHELPTSQRRHHRTVWTSNLVACALVCFVISVTIKPTHPHDFLVMLPLLVILTGTSILGAASFAGWMYISGYAFYLMAVIMALDLSLAGLEIGILMSANILYQSYCMLRLARTGNTAASLTPR